MRDEGFLFHASCFFNMLLNMFKMLLDKRFSQHSSANHVLSTLLSALFGPYVKIM